jgi:hypothetical protein
LQHGFESDAEKKGKNKKGKAKQTTLATPAAKITYTVPIKDFTVLAEFLVGKGDPPVQVPTKFGALFDRAILSREWYSAAIPASFAGRCQETKVR